MLVGGRADRHSAPTRRVVLAWDLMIGSLVGFWCCRPWLGTRVFRFMAGSGYGGPSLYILVQYLGVAIENRRSARRLLNGHPWLGRAWTWAVVVLPVGLFLHPGLVDGFLVPLLVQTGVPGLER